MQVVEVVHEGELDSQSEWFLHSMVENWLVKHAARRCPTFIILFDTLEKLSRNTLSWTSIA